MDFGEDSELDKAKELESLLLATSTNATSWTSGQYESLRADLIANPAVKQLLPDFVRSCRTIEVFRSHMFSKSSGTGSWAERRKIISEAFTPVMDYLEGNNQNPADVIVDDTLRSFDAEGVHQIWTKALDRRISDAEGAITVARTLLETVCKKILDDMGVEYTNNEDLPKLYNMTAKLLNLAPDQHSQEPIKAILGGAMTLVNGLGTLRNRLSDSHGRGGNPVKPSPRHAQLAVNMAGALATFLVETHTSKKT